MQFIVERYKSSDLYEIKDSAGGSAKNGRDARFQSILPLRGKIINAEKEDFSKVMKNDEVKSIINAIGAGFGEDFNIKKVQYHRIIIMADSDSDEF